MTKVLTDPFVRNLKPADAGKRYAVSDAMVPGLRVRVTDKGNKSFILWCRVDPKQSSASALSLGEVGAITLAGARRKAREWLALIAQGTDPRHSERATKDATFAVVMEDYLTRHVKGQRKADDVDREMRTELLSRWKNKPVAAITRRDVIRMVDEIRDRGAPYQARNMLGHAKTFFNWCIEKDIVATSPCDRIKPARLIGPKLPRHRVLSDDEIRAFWSATEQMDYPIGPLFRMLLLTGQRKSEVAEAQWREFDLPNRLWTVPPERFKSDISHIVPLSDDVLALLEDLPEWKTGDFLFSTDGRKPVNGFSKAKERLGKLMGDPPPFVIHDLRRTMRTRLSSLRIPDVIAEMCIGHGRKGLQRVYDQHAYVEEMREALDAWAVKLRKIVTPQPANVVSLHGAAS